MSPTRRPSNPLTYGAARKSCSWLNDPCLVVAGPSHSGLQVAGPSNSGSQVAGPSHSGLQVTGPSQSGPQVAGPSHSGLQVAGPSHSGPQVAGPSHSGLQVAGPSHSGLQVAGPSHSGLQVAGPSHSGLQVAGPSHSGLQVAGPSHSGLQVAGPSHSSLQVAGPSHSSLKIAGPSDPIAIENAGPTRFDTENAGPSRSGPDVTSCSSQERRGRGRRRGGTQRSCGTRRPRGITVNPPIEQVNPSLRPPSPIRESDLVTRTTGEWVLALSSVAYVPKFQTSCECGGGSYLGSIHTIAMYENHRLIDCATRPKNLFIPYLSSTYFNALKVFESVTNDENANYETKVFNLIRNWENCDSILCSDPCSGTHKFIHFAASESAILILDPEWEKIPKEVTSNFTRVINKILHTLQDMKCHLESVKSCHLLLSIIADPWNHHFLPKLLYGVPSLEEVIDFIKFEKSDIFVLRLKILCEGNCESQALILSKLAVNVYHNIQMKNGRIIFENKDLEFILDVYFGCLEQLNEKEELVGQLQKCISYNNANTLMEKYFRKINNLSNIPKKERPRICNNVSMVCQMGANIIVAQSLLRKKFAGDFYNFMVFWSNIMLTLMNSDLKLVNTKYLKELIRKFIEMTPTASQSYTFCEIMYEKFGSMLPLSMYLEMYVHALTKNLNEKKYNRQMADTTLSFNSLKELTQGYLRLANLLKDVVSVCRECVLTAYSLMPSEDLLSQVENLAIKSGKLSTENSTVSENSCDKPSDELTKNSTAVVSNVQKKRKSKIIKSDQEQKMIDYTRDDSYTKIRFDLDNLPEPLSPIMQDNLISVIKYPRYGSFNWDLEWPEMKLRCQRYLDNFDIIIQRNMLRREHLKYLDIDIDEYNKTISKKMKKLTNNKGYFSTDNSSDDELSAASSGEMVSYRSLQSKKQTRKRKVRSRKRKVTQKRSKAGVNKKPKISSQRNPSVTVPRRSNLRSQKSFEVTDESTVGSLLNDETKDISQNCNNEVEDNSVDLVLEKNDNVKKNYRSPEKVVRNKRIVNKNQHKDFDYSWCPRRGTFNKKSNLPVGEALSNIEQTTSKSDNFHLIGKTSFELSHSSSEHLSMLSERVPQLSSLEFIMPANTDHIINVVQIQATSNTLTNVSQTQTEHVSNHHSNNEIEKKTNDSQTDTHPLDSFVSLYQSNSLNNSSGSHQGECSFTGSVSVSNQRIPTDSITNVQSISPQGTSKPLDSNDVMIDQNQINLDRCWNDIQLQNSGERIQPTVENAVHLSSNVIVRTSDVINTSNLTQTSGNITTTIKKPTTYCVKTRDRLIDFSLPASISSISTNNNRSTTMPVVMHQNKSSFDPKNQQNSPVQTSVGLQVNFSNQQSEVIQSMISPNNQPQISTKISENPTSTNISVLNDHQIINSRINTSSIGNSSFIKENNTMDNLKSNVSLINPVSSIQTQTCIGLRPSNDASDPNSSVISLMIASTQSQVIKTNVQNSLYTSSPNKKIQLADLSHTSQTNRSDEQKKIDNLKLVSQTFTATSEAIKFVTSNTESQHLIQSTEKNTASNLAIFHNVTEGVSSISQENDSNPKSSNRGRGNMRTYESKTRALKQANMSDMFVFEKGTLYAVQDDAVNQMEPTKSVVSPKNTTMTNIKIQNRLTKELLDKPKLSPNASPNITITGSMLPRFQQVFGKTKFQSSNIINDTSSLCSSSVASIPSSNSGTVVNRAITSTSRVYSSSKGVQTNNDVDPISSNTLNCIPTKGLENKLQHNISMTKSSNVMTVGNNKNNVIMTCKTVSSVKNVPQVSASSSHQLLTSNIDAINTAKKEATSMSISKLQSFTTSCNNSSVASSSSNLIYSIPLQSDSKASSIEKSAQGTTQIQRQLKVSPTIIQTVLRKHPTWQQNCFRQGKQSTEVQTTVERLIPANITNIVKTSVESLNHKVSISTSKSNVTEPNVSSSMMEQVREFESVLEEVRKTSLMNEMSTANMLPQINHEIIQIHSPTENVDLLNTDNNQTLFPLNKKTNVNNERERCSFSFLNQTLTNVNDLASEEKEPVPSAVISVRSVTPTPPVTSPNNNLSVSPVDGSTQCSKQIVNKVKPVIKTPASSPSTSAVKVPVLQKPLPKLQEDEQTTQRIYAILDKYAEQLRNSPELKNKPAPRRRTNPPTNPSLNAKRKKSNQLNLKTCSQQTSCSSSGMEMSPTSDMQAIDSEDSSNAVSHFSHIINSPSRNTDEQTTATVISETPLIENTLINVNDVIKKINVDAEMKSKVSQSTQIVVSGTSGSFLSIPEGSTGNVRLLVAAGNNQKMYRLHCPTGPGPVLFHQITAKDSCSNDVKMSSNILGQNLNESTILSAITTDDLQVTNSGIGNEILLNTSQNSTVFEHKINKPDIILESMEKAQVLDNNEKPLTFPVMKKNQASQSTFSVIHTLPCKPKSESNDNKEIILTDTQKNISENIQKKVCDNEQNNSNTKQELVNNSKINKIVLKQEKLGKTLKEEPPYIPPKSSESSSIPFDEIEFTSFHSHKMEQENNQKTSSIHEKKSQQTITKIDENKFENTNTNQFSVDCLNDNKLSNDSNTLHVVKSEKTATTVKQEKSSNITTEDSSNILKISNINKEHEENKPNIILSDVAAAASAAEIISTANQTYKQKEELSPKIGKTECESENENENTLSNTVYNMLDNQSATGMNTKIGSLTLRLKNDRSAKNWNSCLSKIMPPGTEKMFESENLKQLQESFQHTQIKTFKDLKMFVFEHCKKFDNNVETPKEYDLYDDIDGLGVDKPSTNELFPEVAILNDLDKSVSPTLGLLQASTSRSNDSSALQAKRKSVLSHTTTSTVISSGIEQTNIMNKKTKNKVSFLKQALYNEMNQDSNDGETKSYINGSTKTVFDSNEQIDLCPESPLNITAVDSETCMSEDSTSTISSGTPHYNFRKSKRKNIEEDGFIESQVIKRMYRGRTSEDNDDKSDPPKINNTRNQMSEQKSSTEKKESNHRRLSNRLKNNNVKNNQHLSNKSSQLDSPPYKITTTRSSLRRVSRKTT